MAELEGTTQVEPGSPSGSGRDVVVLRLPAAGAYLSVLRTATASLASRLDFTIDDIEDLRIAVDEACAMLLTQARARRRPRVQLRAHLRRDPRRRQRAHPRRPGAVARHLRLDRAHRAGRRGRQLRRRRRPGHACRCTSARPTTSRRSGAVTDATGRGAPRSPADAPTQPPTPDVPLVRRRRSPSRGVAGPADAAPGAHGRRPRQGPRDVPAPAGAAGGRTPSAPACASSSSRRTCRSSSTWPAASATAASRWTTSSRSPPSA